MACQRLAQLLLALLAASGAAECDVGAGSCGRDAAKELGTGADAEESVLLQNTTRRKMQVINVHRAEGHKVKSLEALADMNLLDLNCTDEQGVISKSSWMSAFERLDKNGNGKITYADLRDEEDAPPKRPSNLTKKNFNLTRKQLKAGLALLTTWFPEEAGRLVANEALLTTLAFNGQMPADDEPEPEDPLKGVVKRRQRRRNMSMVVTNQVARKNACVIGVIKLAVGVFNILFSIIGLDLPSGSTIGALIEGNNVVMDQLVTVASTLDKSAGPMSAAGVVKEIFGILYEEGIFSAAIQQALADLNWWQFSVMTVQIAAIVAAWLGTGGVAFVANIALLVFDVADLWDGAQQVKEAC